MSFAPNPGMGYAQNEEFFSNPQLAMRLALQQRGMGDRNWLSRRLMERANEAIPLSLLYGAGPENFLSFLNQYVSGQTQADGPMNAGDIRQRAGNFLQGTGNPALDEWLRQGSDEEQFQKFQSFRNLSQRGYNPAIQRGQQALDERAQQDWWIKSRQNPTGTPETWIDQFLGRSPQQAVAPTPGMTPTAPPPNPNMVQTPVPPGQWAPTQPGQPSTPIAPANPYAPPASAAPASAYGNWADVLNKYRADQRNWGTEGFRPNPGAFTIGGMRYDPTQDTTRMWSGMSGRGRQTSRGNFMGQFMYTLQQLMDQAARGGNAAYGVTPGMDVNQIARIAYNVLSKRVGSQGTGFSMV